MSFVNKFKIFVWLFLICGHQAQNSGFPNVEIFKWTPGEKLSWQNSLDPQVDSCVSPGLIALIFMKLQLHEDKYLHGHAALNCFKWIMSQIKDLIFVEMLLLKLFWRWFLAHITVCLTLSEFVNEISMKNDVSGLKWNEHDEEFRWRMMKLYVHETNVKKASKISISSMMRSLIWDKKYVKCSF